jgi:hypothetical protein
LPLTPALSQREREKGGPALVFRLAPDGSFSRRERVRVRAKTGTDIQASAGRFPLPPGEG